MALFLKAIHKDLFNNITFQMKKLIPKIYRTIN